MRLLNTLLLCLLLPAVALPQGKPVLERLGELEFGDAQERVVAYKFVGGENKLVLVGRKVIRVLDVAGAKFLESRPIEVPEFDEDRPREISPDGRRMIVFGNYGSRRKGDKVKRPPSVWDLRTGERIAALDKTSKPVRAAVWSENGKTLATSSDRYAPRFTDSSSVEVSFWDGETFEYKNSLPTDKAGWWHLTGDGDKCVYSAGEVKGRLILLDTKYVSPAGPISVWDIGGGKIEQTISARGGNVERKIRSIGLSPDGKFLALVVQPPKSKDAERRLSVWEMDKGDATPYEVRPKYEIKPAPKIDEHGVMFSPGGKYFALEAGKNLQIYETRTGEKRFELPNFDSPSAWLNDDIVYDKYSTRMEAFDVATGRQLYQQKLVYDAFSYWVGSYDPNDTSRAEVTEVRDETTIVAHPRGTMFLTHSNQYVKVFDSRTGEPLQTLVSPPTDYTKKKPGPSDKPLVYKADWSDDGKTLYVISADRRTVSLWRLR